MNAYVVLVLTSIHEVHMYHKKGLQAYSSFFFFSNASYINLSWTWNLLSCQCLPELVTQFSYCHHARLKLKASLPMLPLLAKCIEYTCTKFSWVTPITPLPSFADIDQLLKRPLGFILITAVCMHSTTGRVRMPFKLLPVKCLATSLTSTCNFNLKCSATRAHHWIIARVARCMLFNCQLI